MLDGSQIFDGTLNPVAGVLIAGTQPSTNTIDWMASRDMGVTDNLGIVVQILAGFTGCTSLQIDYETSNAVGGPYVPLIYSPVIPLADLVLAGRIFAYALPINQANNYSGGVLQPPGRYARLNYTMVGAETTGKLFSYVVPHLDRSVIWNYSSNYSLVVPPTEVLRAGENAIQAGQYYPQQLPSAETRPTEPADGAPAPTGRAR